jgi:hypothetical protein
MSLTAGPHWHAPSPGPPAPHWHVRKVPTRPPSPPNHTATDPCVFPWLGPGPAGEPRFGSAAAARHGVAGLCAAPCGGGRRRSPGSCMPSMARRAPRVATGSRGPSRQGASGHHSHQRSAPQHRDTHARPQAESARWPLSR